jgi:hypothetical protein
LVWRLRNSRVLDPPLPEQERRQVLTGLDEPGDIAVADGQQRRRSKKFALPAAPRSRVAGRSHQRSAARQDEEVAAFVPASCELADRRDRVLDAAVAAAADGPPGDDREELSGGER